MAADLQHQKYRENSGTLELVCEWEGKTKSVYGGANSEILRENSCFEAILANLQEYGEGTVAHPAPWL